MPYCVRYVPFPNQSRDRILCGRVQNSHILSPVRDDDSCVETAIVARGSRYLNIERGAVTFAGSEGIGTDADRTDCSTVRHAFIAGST